MPTSPSASAPTFLAHLPSPPQLELIRCSTTRQLIRLCTLVDACTTHLPQELRQTQNLRVLRRDALQLAEQIRGGRGPADGDVVLHQEGFRTDGGRVSFSFLGEFGDEGEVWLGVCGGGRSHGG